MSGTYPLKTKASGMISIQRLIMLILSLLVALLILGMWLMSSLKLGLAQDAVAELRQRQIADTFYANLECSNADHHHLQQNTADLARLDERYQRLYPSPGRFITAQPQLSLRQTLTDSSPAAYASTLSFQPSAIGERAGGMCAYRNTAETLTDTSDATFSFLLDNDNRNLSSRASGNNGAHALFCSHTQPGMVFGSGVAQADIDVVLTPMPDSNLRIVAVIGGILLILSALVLFLVASTLRRLRRLYTDPLTHLPNRERLLVDLRNARAASLILLNIDDFKELNDFYGHECGDHVIALLAEALQRHLQQQAGWSTSRLYRMPADELAIWIPGIYSQSQLEARLASLRTFVDALSIDWEGHQISLHASMGLASTRLPGGSSLRSELLLPSANIALKMARLRHSSYLIYDPAHRVRENYQHNLVWANKLKAALDEHRIVPFFQPIIDLSSGRILKFECLARMIDEMGQPVSPSQFLPAAKKIRLYRYITRCMIEQCFARFADNQYEFSLNLSCEDLLDPQLCSEIIARLENSGMAERVIFEILESEGIENYAPVRLFIDKVKALGCRIAIDDFGTGYSNFEHLLRLNVDLIKIDGSLIRQLDTDANALTLTRGIVRFAGELGIQTVAEFVHSPAIYAQVKALGVDYAQGACIGMPAATLVTEINLQ